MERSISMRRTTSVTPPLDDMITFMDFAALDFAALTFATIVFCTTAPAERSPWLTPGFPSGPSTSRYYLDTIHLECRHLLVRLSINSYRRNSRAPSSPSGKQSRAELRAGNGPQR
jgi:hypothetical protein